MTTREYFASEKYADVLLPALSSEIRHGFGVCGILHPQTESCTRGMLYILFNVFPLAMRVYTPLNLAVLLLFKRHRLAKDPRGVILSLIKSSVRSSVFLAVLIVGIINFSCGMRAVLGRESYWSYIITGSVGGLAVLLEAPSRRIELAMYCFLRALESGWDVGVKRRWWKNVRHGEVALFSAATGVLMSIYQNDPSTISMTYLSVLTRIFGRN
ncbi:hypothetical protein DL89DRAFT_224566 [Linderina pennispora]|uniref:Transmembrane protein 135 N-terminal domain-containing protein n=1 Tax=Linderina pennispora TaxID=61395 RepID=A0A1Y1W5E6_9FUNG|nr:uncharacterized protein DL89DRAFT_227468 [Linderina pennispora]XP_040742535.1 uncharacterized protein DL89DRAFT_224566 [Linderina pennispora]ORX65615.1 hypothetical protein DL89DRAFT_227468 [Linderina pennispora]ORX68753.1 hypothetical protein DL89DRAFT_224566 [Linderina pennispora]